MSSWIEDCSKYIANALLAEEKFKKGKAAVVGKKLCIQPSWEGCNISCLDWEDKVYHVAYAGFLFTNKEFLTKSIANFLSSLDFHKLDIHTIGDTIEFDFQGDAEKFPARSPIWDLEDFSPLLPNGGSYACAQKFKEELLREMGVRPELLQGNNTGGAL